MAQIPLQTLEELDLTAEEFEELVDAGLTYAVGRVLDSEDVEEALAQADQTALDAILVFWAAYVSQTLVPSLDLSMISAAAQTVARLASVLSNPLTLIVDQPLDTEQYLLQAANRLVGIGNELWFNARTALAEGIALGESQPKLAARIREAVGVTQPRARVIARTESHGARNVAAMATMQRFETAYGVPTGVMRKTWQATNDPRTRHTHVEADGQTVGFSDPFSVGGASLAFPGDPAGPAQEVINCRCTTYAMFDPADLDLNDNGTVVTINAAAFPEEDDAMPWHVVPDHAECGSGQFAVVKNDDGEVEGCHDTEESAMAQMAALYAAEEDMALISTLTASANRSGWSDMPVAPAAHGWDGPGAAGRVASQCGVDEADASAEAWNCYAGGFLYRDDNADPQTKGAYKLGVVDIIDGRKHIVPRGVFAVAGVLRGARGGAAIPRDQQTELRSVVSGLYDRINEALGTDHAVPWDDNSASLTAAAGDQSGRYASVSGPIVVGDRVTGDRRQFDIEALEWQQVGATPASLEIPLGYQYERGHGDGGSDKVSRVGRIDRIERVDGELFAHGVIDLQSPRGMEAARQMDTRDDPGTLSGVSVIIDENPDGPGLMVEYQFAEGCDTEESEFDEACAIPERTIIHQGARVRAVDLVDIPAFAEARLYLDAPLPQEDNAEQTLTASAYTITIPDLPPLDWFEEPKDMPEIGAITVTDEGRVFGYLAPKNVAHRSYRDKRVTVPTRNVDYGIWMNRPRLVDDGHGSFTRVATGPITMSCGHAPMGPKGAARREHYDNSCSVVATARVGENRHGVWIAGALLPGVTAEQVAEMMACQLSGDWGPHREKPGKRELAAAHLVPVPGFPTAHHSFTMHGDDLLNTTTPLRFGVVAAEDGDLISMRAAAHIMAAEIGQDRDARLRAFALDLREQLKGDS